MEIRILKKIIDLFVQTKRNPIMTLQTTIGYIDFEYSSKLLPFSLSSEGPTVIFEISESLVDEVRNMFPLTMSIEEEISIVLLTGFLMGTDE